MWRDWRAGELRLLLIAVALAVAALSAVGFFADRLLARRDRVEPRRQRAQCLHERLRIPCAGMALQHVDDLQVLQRTAQVGLATGLQHVGKSRIL